MQGRQGWIPARSEFGSLDERGLQPWIALFRNGATLLLVGSGPESRGQSTVAHYRRGRGEAPRIPDLQCPGQCSNISHSGNAGEAFDSLCQLRIGEQFLD